MAGAAVVDPATGLDVASADQGAVQRWLTDFHRSLLMGDTGRYATAVAALALLVLALSGAMLVARRQSGWARWFAPIKGPWAGRWHAELARVSLLAEQAWSRFLTREMVDAMPLRECRKSPDVA